jgi:hypothetical protein
MRFIHKFNFSRNINKHWKRLGIKQCQKYLRFYVNHLDPLTRDQCVIHLVRTSVVQFFFFEENL